MEEELNYLSEKAEKVEQRIVEYEKMHHFKDSPGLQHVVKSRKKELELLNNILTVVTNHELKQ